MPEASTAPADLIREAPSGRRDALAAVGGWAFLLSCGSVCVWVVLEAADVLLSDDRTATPDAVAPYGVLVVALLLATVVVLATSRLPWLPRRDEPVVLAVGGTLLGGAALGSLHGTAWGFDGLYSDAGFRTEAVTRFTTSPVLDDYAYADLPAYYPVLWPWLQGRTADLLGLPGWLVMKPAQVLVCLIIPALAWLLWRRVLPSRLAALVAVATTLATALPNKPDEWLVLCLLVPWWLEVCRGLGRPDVPRWGPWRHGVVLGLLLLLHTYFFAPLALATVLGFTIDLLRRRDPHPAPLRALVIGLVGLVVATPTWWPVVAARLRDLPSDDLQRRWSPPGFDLPALPLPYDPRGVLELVGVVWLLWAARRSRLAAALLLALGVSYVFMVGGQLLQPFGLAVLPEKSEELSELLLIAAAVLAAPVLLERLRGLRARVRAAWIGVAVVVTLLATALSLHRGMLEPAAPAATMRYPEGGFPAGGMVPASPRWHPWGVAPGESGPAVSQVQAAWRDLTGAELGDDDVLVSARADVSATVPVHLFVTWKSIYSHPNGQFEARVNALRELAQCAGPRCAQELLRTNPYDPVDGLLLNRDGESYFLTVTLDNFPEGWIPETIELDPRLFDSPRFDVAPLPGAALIHVRP